MTVASTSDERRFTRRIAGVISVQGVVVLLILLGTALRLFQLGSQSIWYDEAYSVALANQPISAIITNVIGDHVPFYFILLKGWMMLFGQGEFAIRSLSVVFGVATIPCAYFVTRRLFNRSTGLITALIVTFSPFLVYYAQETRMYSLVTLQALLLAYALLIGLEGRRAGWFVYALVGMTLLYTHYYGLVFIASQAVFILIWLILQRRSPQIRQTFICALLAGAFLALSFLPWAWQRASVFDSFISAASQTINLGSIVWQSLVAFCLGHSIVGLTVSDTNPVYQQDFAIASWLSVGFVLISIIGIVGLWRWQSDRADSYHQSLRVGWSLRYSLLFVLTVLIMAFILVFFVSIGKRGFTPRYLIMLSPFFYMLLAYGFKYLWIRLRWLCYPAIAFVTVCSLFALSNYYFDPKYSRDDYRSAMQYIQDHPMSNGVVISNAGYALDAVNYYLKDSISSVGLPKTHPLDAADTDRALTDLLKQKDFIWLTLWQDYFSDPQRYVEKWLDTNAILTTQQEFHGGIRVKGYLTMPPLIRDGSQPNARFDYLENKLALVGLQFPQPVSGQEWPITLYFKVLAPIEKDYTLYTHLLGSDGQPWVQHDAQPYNGHYPTSHWEPGKIVKVEDSVKIPAFSPTCDYRLEVGFYDLATMQRLGNEEKDRFVIEPVHIAYGNDGMPKDVTRSDFDFGGQIALRGLQVGDAQRGESLSLTTYWQTLNAASPDYTVFVHLLDQNGNMVAQKDAPPGLTSFPTSQWGEGQTIADFRSFELPQALPSGSYRLVVGVYDSRNGQRLPVKPHLWDRSQDALELESIIIR